MERCPHCRGKIHDTRCCRCDAELELVLEIEKQAEKLTQRGVHSLWAGQLAEAKSQLERARSLDDSVLHQALADFAGKLLLQRTFLKIPGGEYDERESASA